ncbi:PcfK-like family protein [Clostridium lacusfryxellense]|uniref:PcfK-like family protein n=1 Tax=Clostridium lacusfryxellense TaxID=205328 RepID=UPI001C0B1566|nr:PcfK-like family protein [Clostridium lacusfryxellense]MBU3111970.1 PcfK-like family protein [Clostridium lacusfryxellense]
MLEKAIKKINDEIEKNKNDTNIKVIGDFLVSQLKLNVGASEKVLQDGKTIKGSIEEMRKVAKSKAVNGCGMLTDEEGFGIVLKYFDIKFTPVSEYPLPIKVTEDPVAPIVQNEKVSIDFNVDLGF